MGLKWKGKIKNLFMKISGMRYGLKLAFFIILLLAFDLFVTRSILFIGGFQSSDIDVGWIGINGVEELFSPWNFETLGGVNSPAGNFFLSSYASLVFGPGLSEKILYYSSIIVSSLALFILSRELKLSFGKAALISFIFQLNPWFIGEFMTGEPAMTWMYALLPLVAYFVHMIFKHPSRVWIYPGLALSLALAEMFTLQSLAVYAFLLVPLTLSMLADRTNTRRMMSLGGIFFAICASLLMNIYSLSAYFSAASDLVASSSSNISALFGGFSSPAALTLKPWIVILFFGTMIASVILYRNSSFRGKIFLFSTTLFQSFFLIIYFAIPSPVVSLLYTKIPIFTPFQNYDKFLLMPTVYSFSLVLFTLVKVGKRSPGINSITVLKNGKHWRHKGYVTSSAHYLVAMFLVIILIASFLFSSIQPVQANINGNYYLRGEFSFPSNQIPSQYYELRSFLLSHGENFGLSSHVLVVPQNPGNILPFYVGETIIPGFIGPTPDLYNIIRNIADNQSSATYLMSLLGIKYVAILADPGDSNWPGATGQVSEGGWAGGYFPQGNSTYYTNILESWSSLKPIYVSTNITILENMNYSGYAYFFKQSPDPYYGGPFRNVTITDAINNVSSASYNLIYDTTPIGQNIIVNPSLKNFSAWNFNAVSGNASLLANGTVVLNPGSKGASLSQNVALLPNTTYDLSLYVNTHPGYQGFPPNGDQRNYVGIYWNGGTGYNGTAGASIDGYFNGNFTGTREFIFSTPQHNGIISAQFILAYEPPIENQTIYITYSNVTLRPVNGSVIFSKLVSPVELEQNNNYGYYIANYSDISGGFVVLDTSYNPDWVALTANGSIIHSTPGPLGLTEFYVENGTHISSVYYAGAKEYSIMVWTGWLLFGAFFVTFAVIFSKDMRKRIKLEGHKGGSENKDFSAKADQKR